MSTPQDENGAGWGAPTPPPAAPSGWSSPSDQPPAPPGWGTPTAPPVAPRPPVVDNGWGAAPAGPPPGGYGPVGTPYGWAPPPLQPGIIPLRPLSLGEILDGAVRAIRANPRVMFGLSAVVVTVAVALQTLLTVYVGGLLSGQVADLLTQIDPSGELTVDPGVGSSMSDSLGAALAQLVSLPVTEIVVTILTGLLIVSVSRSVLGQQISIGEVLRSGRVWWVVGFSVLTLLAVVSVSALWAGLLAWTIVQEWWAAAVIVGLLGGLALLVASVWFSIRTLLVPPALMLEGKGFWTTVGRGWRLTRGSFWRLLGIYLLTSILVGVLAQIIAFPTGAIATLVTQSASVTSPAYLAITGVGSVLALTLSTTYTAAVIALLYIDVRMRREGLDVELGRAASAGA